MSGILDKKSRILDAILTIEGRRQMAEGTFEVSYVTFSDFGVNYIPDDEEGHVDPTTKIYFEACNLPQDQITFESNDSGNLNPLRMMDIKIASGSLMSGSTSGSFSVSNGTIMNGRLVAYRYVNGRMIEVTNDLQRSTEDFNRGFVYYDANNVSGSVLIDPNRVSETVIIPDASKAVAYIGSNTGVWSEKLANCISSAVNELKKLAVGPDVSAYAQGKRVFLDGENDATGLRIIQSGTLSSPLIVQESPIGGNLLFEEISGPVFASQIEGILTSSFDNFSRLQTISSIDRNIEDDQFELSTNELDFNIEVNSPSQVLLTSISPPSVNTIDSLFSDENMTHLDNFLYLPPIVKVSDAEVPDKSDLQSLRGYQLGDYPSWGDNEKKLTYNKFQSILSSYKDVKAPVSFTKTSLKNTVMGQMFEVHGDTVSKLDIVDYGLVPVNPQDSSSEKKRVFFVGKTYLDNKGTACFANMFTLVFAEQQNLEVV